MKLPKKNESNNSFIIHKNRGMLLEEFINKSINYYNKNLVGYFFKKNLDIKFGGINNRNMKLINPYITSKSTVDYYGIYKGKYVAFEAKSTELDNLPFTNLKKHQHEHLELIKKLGGIAFYIIYFKKFNLIYLIDVSDLNYRDKKSISIKEIQTYGKKLEITFPGIINFLDYI